MLNFVNLKKIDRPSISIRLAASSHKKDGKRVTLLGDKTEYYIK